MVLPDGGMLSRGPLHMRANLLVRLLLAHGLGPEDAVGLMFGPVEQLPEHACTGPLDQFVHLWPFVAPQIVHDDGVAPV